MITTNGAIQAIEFAVNLDDSYEAMEFLKSWQHGDTSEWPAFSVPKDPNQAELAL